MYRGIRTAHERDLSKKTDRRHKISLAWLPLLTSVENPSFAFKCSITYYYVVGAFGCSPQAHDAAVNSDGPLKPVRLYQDAEDCNAGMCLVSCLCVCHTWEPVAKHNS
jgi:hypothetical protein